MIDIGKKLDEIREKPEHIRIRYVWGAVGVSMILVISVWVFSIKEAFRSTKTESISGSFIELKNQFNAQKENMPSFDSLMPEEELIPDSIEKLDMENNSSEGQVSGETIKQSSDPQNTEQISEENKQ